MSDDPAMAAMAGHSLDGLPWAYGNAIQSPLSIDVPEPGVFDLEVKTPPRKK
jgi:hypothetical protein